MGDPRSETSFNTMFLTAAERVIRGCFYGSAYPDRDFPWILEMYRAGRLDLDAATGFVRSVAGPEASWPEEAAVSLDIGSAISAIGASRLRAISTASALSGEM